jgi:hypothetical protein
MGGSDVMGAQWLYASSLSLVILGYIGIRYTTYAEAISQVFAYKFTLVFTLLLFWAIGSYFYAINPTETLVTLARLITTYFVFINLSILFYQQDQKTIFTGIAYGITLLLFFDAIYILKTFSANLRTMNNLDSAILGINKYHGNKNVTAASLLIMIPFSIYVIMSAKWLGRIAGIIALFLGVFSLFLLNTRSTYVGFALITVLFFIGIIWQNKAQLKSVEGELLRVATLKRTLILEAQRLKVKKSGQKL